LTTETPIAPIAPGTRKGAARRRGATQKTAAGRVHVRMKAGSAYLDVRVGRIDF
jgi:hypothetical protein